MPITKTSGAAPRQILLHTNPAVSFGIVVDDAVGIVVGTRKIAKAGTPLYGDMNARTTPFVAETTTGDPAASNAVGVLLHDVDVTDGDANAQILVFGYVNTNRLETDVQALITAEVKAALDCKVTFLAG